MHCQLCERDLYGTAAYLCDRCRDELAEHLAELPVMFGQLLVPLRAAADVNGTRGGASRAGLDRHLDAISSRAGFDVLVSWQAALYTDRDWPAPGLHDDPGERITAAAGALRASLPWIAASWPAAGDCAAEIRDLHRGAASVVGAPVRAVRMGLCPTVRDGQPCGAPLTLPPGQQVIRCAWCDATYPPGIWAALRRAQQTTAA